jgi:YebC/PmpR family DNA-binding regulatory protein
MGKSWKNPIKAENAAKKGAVFTKFAKEIQVAAKLGGADPEYNSRLRLAVDMAKKNSVPNDTIDRAIKKGAGLIEGFPIEELTYEGYGPHGVGIIVETQTDNKTRTVAEIRNLFKKSGGQMGETGSVSWMFERVGLIEAHKKGPFDPEEEAIECNANSVESLEDEHFEFVTHPDSLDESRKTLLSRGWTVTKGELGYKTKNKAALSKEQEQEVIEFLNTLDDHDDTHRIYSTWEFDS